ncbi:hypothetical protein [Metabacillus sp. FJAT-53654]|uniref:Uncharacterized protein n=1 Tax=Metabacillus rhizosphaerae TaxID=3117747 RepID=A0ABZ2MNV6_9BACI
MTQFTEKQLSQLEAGEMVLTNKNSIGYMVTGGDFGSFSEEGGSLIKEAEQFTVGTHRGVNYSEEDLQTLVKNFKGEDSVPIQLDHSESSRDTVGFLKAVSVKAGKLLGKLEIIDPEAIEKVKNGLYKKLSISFYLDTKGKPSLIREVSLVAFPQMKTAQLFSEEETPKGKMSPAQRMRFLLDKALNTSQPLSKEELEELHGYLDEIEEEEAKRKAEGKQESLSETIEKTADKAILRYAIKTQKQKLFDEQPLAAKHFQLKQQVEKLQKSSFYMKQLEKERKQKEAEEFDRFYEDWVKKNGRTL